MNPFLKNRTKLENLETLIELEKVEHRKRIAEINNEIRTLRLTCDHTDEKGKSTVLTDRGLDFELEYYCSLCNRLI